MTIKNFYPEKDPVKRMKGQVTDGDKYFHITLSGKRRIARMYKALSKLDNKTHSLEMGKKS